MSRPAIDLFQNAFGTIPRSAASAPGRVNLIGEHTDYNGGPVLPIAIAERTTAAVGPGPADAPGTLEAISTHYNTVARVRWQEELPQGWPAYVAGVLRELWTVQAIPPRGSLRIAVASDVPIGAGLSSSAALAVATLGKRGHALLLECASLEVQQIPFTAPLLLVDTGVKHDLSVGSLNERRAECEEAVKRLKLELPELSWLASWPVEWLPRLKRALPEPLRSRAVHVVSETARARFAAQLLASKKLTQFGKLLYESHESCRRLYACSAPELDTVVAAAKRAGALGARLTGAGWGGAAIVLVKERGKGSAEPVAQTIHGAFRKAYGREPQIREVKSSAGARTERL